MIVSDWLKASMRKLGILALGETPEDEEMQNALFAAQVMLRSWSATRIFAFASVRESFTLSAVAMQTFGVGGTLNSGRPNQILGAVIRDSAGSDHQIDIISEGLYRSISVKGVGARPYALFFHPTVPLAEVYFYPTPVDIETLLVDSLKPFTETSSFDDFSSTLAVPVNYEEALIYNLVPRLASEYKVPVPPEVISIASSSYDRIVTLNAANQVEPVYLMLPVGSSLGGRYSINSDSYRR